MPTPESCFPVRPFGPRRVGSSQPRSRDRNDPRVGEPTEVITSALNRLAKAGLVVRGGLVPLNTRQRFLKWMGCGFVCLGAGLSPAAASLATNASRGG